MAMGVGWSSSAMDPDPLLQTRSVKLSWQPALTVVGGQQNGDMCRTSMRGRIQVALPAARQKVNSSWATHKGTRRTPSDVAARGSRAILVATVPRAALTPAVGLTDKRRRLCVRHLAYTHALEIGYVHATASTVTIVLATE